MFWIHALAVRPDLVVSDLRCEFRIDPVDMDVARPRLSWLDSSSQSAYEIRASSKGTPIWDSGQVRSSQSIEIPYDGKLLSSLEDVSWSVRVWDDKRRASAWSPQAKWSMGLLEPSDWSASWIQADPNIVKGPFAATQLFRREVQVGQALVRARAFVCGLGQYEMDVNGKKVGQDWLTPGWTQYAKTCIANEIDITRSLHAGSNMLGMILGNGMYSMAGDTRGSQQPNGAGPDKLIAQIVLDYRDGHREKVVTDGSWVCKDGPESYSGVFGGEDFDARRLSPAWDQVDGESEPGWSKAKLTVGPGGVLRGATRMVTPLETVEVRNPVKKWSPKPGLLVLDLGQNAPYVPEITVRGPAGTTLKMEPSEVLHTDGTINQDTMRSGKYASYTLAGSADQTWHPYFWYVGSRYWQLSAVDSAHKPIDPASVLVNFQGLMVHQAVEQAGEFSCSDPLFNKITPLIKWAIRGNLGPVISDCPHREKSGWLEQLHLMGPELMSSYDLHVTLSTMLDNMDDAQHPNGMVPTMAPEYFFYDDAFADSVEWGGALILLADQVHTWYGDEQVIPKHYAAMSRYIDYLQGLAPGGILKKGLGDWNGGGADPRTPAEITNTAYYYRLASLMAKFAGQMGRSDDHERFIALAERIRKAFRGNYLSRATGVVGQGSQSAQATALDLGLVEPDEEQKVFQVLLDDVKAQKYAVSCGEVGHPALLHVLQRFGRSDVIARIHSQTELPGYGYQIKKGLTTLAESWDASPISQNHFMLGHILEWFVSGLGGLSPDPAKPGFERFVVDPQMVEQVSDASTSYRSVRGMIRVDWKRKDNLLMLNVQVPANSTCVIPKREDRRVVSIDNRAAAQPVNLASGSHRLVFKLESQP